MKAILLNQTFLCREKELKIISVDDFIAAERAVGIPNSYAVVSVEGEDEVYVVFDTGEVQNEAGEVVAQLPSFEEMLGECHEV